MKRVKSILLFSTLSVVISCIKPFDPVIDGDAEAKYVVSGKITDLEGWQEVSVSTSSSVENPEYIPVEGCQLSIFDDKGDVFLLEEYEPGKYRTWIGQEYLRRGISYQLKVVTPAGEELVSGFDTMPAGPPLDSIYYYIEDHPTNDPEKDHRIMQFYVDLDAEGDFSRYYKWEVIETWEYHSPLAIEYYYDGTTHHVDPPDSSYYVCWSSGIKPEVYTLSTATLSSNIYHQFPLNYVDGESSRLSVLYSILVSQMAISEEAFSYWEKLRINSTQGGALYEKQPIAIQGNIMNTTNPEKEVLGFFYAASESSRRYFYKDVEGIELAYNDLCQIDVPERKGWLVYVPADYPVYYYFNELAQKRILSNECVECWLRGGTLTKPDFWP
jgi:hypothetical protein